MKYTKLLAKCLLGSYLVLGFVGIVYATPTSCPVVIYLIGGEVGYKFASLFNPQVNNLSPNPITWTPPQPQVMGQANVTVGVKWLPTITVKGTNIKCQGPEGSIDIKLTKGKCFQTPKQTILIIGSGNASNFSCSVYPS